MQPFIFYTVQRIFAFISWVSPAIAARFTNLLLTYPGLLVTRTQGERDILKRADTHKPGADALSVVTSAGTMRVYHWQRDIATPAGAPVAILVHGWGAEGRLMADFVPPLLDQGYQVVAIDLPGHGASDRGPTNIQNACELVIATARSLGRADVIIGHSFGASIAVLASTRGSSLHDSIKTQKLVLISAPVSLEDIYRRIARLLEISKRAEDKLVTQVEEKIGTSLSDLNTQTLLAHTPCPTLAIHDEDDFEIPLATSVAAQAISKNIKTLVTKGYGHRGVLSAREVIDAVNKFTKPD